MTALSLWGVQWAKTGRFQLFNYGSAATNSHVYKKPEPPDIAEGYHLLNIPLDVVAGKYLSQNHHPASTGYPTKHLSRDAHSHGDFHRPGCPLLCLRQEFLQDSKSPSAPQTYAWQRLWNCSTRDC